MNIKSGLLMSRDWRVGELWRVHYDRLILLPAILVLVCSVTVIVWEAVHLNQVLAISPAPVRKAVESLSKIGELNAAIGKLDCPSQWTFNNRSGLFVPERHFIGVNGFPTNLRATVAHPPVPNEWLEKFALPLADSDVLMQDPDNDGFNNREEWENQTDPLRKESHPSFVAKLKLKSISQEPFRLVFASRIGQTFAINSNDLKEPTQFLRMGDPIRGTRFELVGFEEKFERNRFDTKVDVSELTLKNTETSGTLILVKERVMTSPVPVANFVYLWGGRRDFAVRKEQRFSLKPQGQIQYKLVDLQPGRARIINIGKPNEPIEIGLLDQ